MSIDTEPDLTENIYLQGACAPVAEEVTAFDLPVVGQIPKELEGRWLRNGPNPIGVVDPIKHHWFVGDGMVHGLRLRGGKAEWYRNRWVRADRAADALGEPRPDGPDFGDRSDLGPNTNVAGFAGRTWAMVEAGGTPVEMTYELDTIGRKNFDGTLPGPFSAHPKYDAKTKELHAVTYAWPDLVDSLQYVVVGSDAKVTKVIDIPVPDMPMVHDMSLTDRYAVIFDLGVTVDFDRLVEGYTLPFSWNAEHECRVGLLPRDGQASDIIWCEVQPCIIFHPLNAYDTPDGKVVIDVCRYDNVFVNDLNGPFRDSAPTLDRWIIDPVAQKVDETRIDDRAHEFPRHNPAYGLREHQFGYTAELDMDSPPFHGKTYKTDLKSGLVAAHDYGVGCGAAEPVFVPKENSQAEDDGWLMTLVYDGNAKTSELHILEAADMAADPVARIQFPQRVPIGFHGNWVPDSSVAPG